MIQLLSPLLLPLGIWLLVSATTATEWQRALSRWALIAVSIATLGFVGFGFGLGFGAYRWNAGAEQSPPLQGGLVVFVSLVGGLPQPVALAGLPQPLLFDRSAPTLWIALLHLPFVLAAALLTTSAIVLQGGRVSAVLVGVLTACVLLPLAFAALSPQGWLRVLSQLAAGSASVTLTSLSITGLVAGGASLGWLLALPRRQAVLERPSLPPIHVPWRAVAGALCVWAGSAEFAPQDAAINTSFFTLAAALSTAVLTAGTYTAFVAHEPDTLSAARAALGAAVTVAGTSLPFEWGLVAGFAAGIWATVGHYMVYERWRLADETGLVASLLVPAITGALISSPFALSAAALSIIVLVGVPLVSALGVAALLNPIRARWTSAPAAKRAVQLGAAPAEAASDRATNPESKVNSAPIQQEEAAPETTEGVFSVETQNAQDSAQETPEPTRRQGWLGDLLRRRRSDLSQPASARPAAQRVAYPYRIGGRSLPVRPVNASTDGADETSARSDKSA
ncbi:MAG: hypothetical protein RMM31_04730 [Anaerolineae bacterium]|nr:hypothetical protein [Thermoflexales bacterium]MDW8395532.1 hypothetical protein [Anaerolineae bacterium]